MKGCSLGARKIIRLIDNYKDLFIVWNYQSYMLKPILKKYSLEPDEVNNDLKILAMKKFIIPFESGVCVITDWRINNYLRNDRYNETK